jgi:hypothetical protein
LALEPVEKDDAIELCRDHHDDGLENPTQPFCSCLLER